VKVLYFAWLRDRVGHAEEEVAPPVEVRTLAQLMEWLAGRSPGHAEAFRDVRAVRAAINQDYAQAGDPVAPGDEVAFFPPVTGGGR